MGTDDDNFVSMPLAWSFDNQVRNLAFVYVVCLAFNRVAES